MPSRKIRPSSYTNTGYIPSSKGPRVQQAESLLEQEYLTLLDFDNRVRGFQSQPFSIRWKHPNGRWREYTPDVIVSYTGAAMAAQPWLRTTVVEVKPREVLAAKWDEMKPRFKAAIAWARLYGCRFQIITDKEIRTPYLQNVQHLTHYRCIRLGEHPSAGRYQRLLLQALTPGATDTPRGLLAKVTSDSKMQAEMIPWLWNLITQDLIGVDLSLPLNMASPIWLTTQSGVVLGTMK